MGRYSGEIQDMWSRTFRAYGSLSGPKAAEDAYVSRYWSLPAGERAAYLGDLENENMHEAVYRIMGRSG